MTLVGPARNARIFIELDRSTKALSRIETTIKHYARYLADCYRSDFPGDLEPHVVFVVPSKERKENMRELAGQMLTKPSQLHIGTEKQVVDWLDRNLMVDATPEPGEATPPAPSPSDLCRFTSELLGEIKRFELENYFAPSFLEHGQACVAAVQAKG
jgi:hypothetical protein